VETKKEFPLKLFGVEFGDAVDNLRMKKAQKMFLVGDTTNLRSHLINISRNSLHGLIDDSLNGGIL
jgi:hypothetical protein